MFGSSLSECKMLFGWFFSIRCNPNVIAMPHLYVLNYGLYDETDITYDTGVGLEDVINAISLPALSSIYKFVDQKVMLIDSV